MAQAGRLGIEWRHARFADRSRAFRPGLLKTFRGSPGIRIFLCSAICLHHSSFPDMTAVESPTSFPSSLRRGTGPVESFVQRLSHPVRSESTGAPRALFQTLISLGLLPLLIWPARWAAYLDSERADLLDLASYWRRRVEGKPAVQLDKIVRGLRRRPMLMVLPWLAVAFNAFAMGSLLLQDRSPRQIWELTVRHETPTEARTVQVPFARTTWRGEHFIETEPVVLGQHEWPINALEVNLHSIWIVGLFLGYLCHFYAVRSHTMTVRSLVGWTNKLGKEHGFTRIKNDVGRPALNAVWVLMAIALCCQGIWWSIPLVVAGALQKRYIEQSSPAIRIALAGQARDGLDKVQGHGDHFCMTEHCGARLPAAAKFCPRCGTAV
jgi:hypothetical protein